MVNKCIRRQFLILISLSLAGLVFSCKGPNKPSVPEVKEKFLVAFEVDPKTEGNIVATVDGTSITSGSQVEKDKVVVFTLTIKNPNLYEVDSWKKATKQTDPLIAHLTVSQDVTVQAKLKYKFNDPMLKLASLSIHHKDVDISNLSDVKVEVENFVKALNSNDVLAMFTYGNMKTPTEIKVKVDKDVLDDGQTLVNLSVPALSGSYIAWEQPVKIKRKVAPIPNVIPNETKLEAIEVALLTAKIVNGKYSYEDFVALENFNSSNAGPYTAKEAKTAYIALKLKATKPTSGDYTIELTNKTTYLSPISFSRATTGDDSYFDPKPVTLSQGYNILELKVKSPDGTKEGVYTILVKYSGGPNPLDKPLEKRKMIDGVYCPVQRKPLEGEKPDFVYLVSIAGW